MMIFGKLKSIFCSEGNESVTDSVSDYFIRVCREDFMDLCKWGSSNVCYFRIVDELPCGDDVECFSSGGVPVVYVIGNVIEGIVDFRLYHYSSIGWFVVDFKDYDDDVCECYSPV